MKIIPFSYSEEWDELELYPLNDIHVGDPNSDVPLLKKFLKFINEKPNRFLILNGDLFNNATKTSKSDSYKDCLPPDKQRELLTEILLPYTEKILVIVCGNHEYRSVKDVNLSAVKWMAESLGKKDYYFEDNAAIKISFGKGPNGKKITYAFWIIHGSGKKNEALINYASGFENCDGVITAHLHNRKADAFCNVRFDLQNNIWDTVERRVIVSSSWLNYAGYPVRGMMRPGVKGTKPVKLYGKFKQVEAIV